MNPGSKRSLPFAKHSAVRSHSLPGNGAEYVRRWIKFLEYRSQVLPEIPLYSNAYMDFMTSALREYNPGIYSSWSEAVQKAYLSDFEEEAEEEVEVGEDEAVFD